MRFYWTSDTPPETGPTVIPPWVETRLGRPWLTSDNTLTLVHTKMAANCVELPECATVTIYFLSSTDHHHLIVENKGVFGGKLVFSAGPLKCFNWTQGDWLWIITFESFVSSSHPNAPFNFWRGGVFLWITQLCSMNQYIPNHLDNHQL